MKYLVNLTFLLFILVSCVQNAPDTSAFDEGLALFEKNKAIADKTFDLFIAKDLDGMNGWMTEFEVFSFNDRQYYPGVDDNFVPDGSVRTYGTWVGTHNSGATTVSKYYSVTQYNDEGKIVTALEWFDVGGVFDQLESQLQN